MLSKQELKDLLEELESAQTPFVFYDDDPDGVISYILLKKRFDQYDGTIIKGAPFLEEKYAERVRIEEPDKVVILDKPMVEDNFFKQVQRPIVWVDHHEPRKVPKNVAYFNPRIKKKSDRSPTSYIMYKAVGGPLWLAMIGVVGDWYISPELKKLSKEKPRILPKVVSPPQVLFDTEFGKLIKIVAFLLKQRISDINNSVEDLLKIKEPEEILEQKTEEGEKIYNLFKEIDKEYQPLLKKALIKDEKNLLVFTYDGKRRSFTGELSNELLHKAKAEVILIGRKKDGVYKMSIRSRKLVLPPILNEALEGLDGHGGGHEQACGASVPVSDFKKFVERIRERI
jgi:single-stranded DNA-specific DHH superfamily exonuclease